MSDQAEPTRPKHRPLGLNQRGYRGEAIDIDALVATLVRSARKHGWSIDWLEGSRGLALPVLSRRPRHNSFRLYLSAGIHGDEPAGPLAVHDLIVRNLWPPDAGLWVCPCLNPSGFRQGTRRNLEGLDLNRDFLQPRSEEIQMHTRWLEQQTRFDLAICLHEDWEAKGFYLYDISSAAAESKATDIINAVAPFCPIDPATIIERRPAREGVIRPQFLPNRRRRWPEAFYLATRKSDIVYTFEAPSDYALEVRQAALMTAVRAAWLGMVPTGNR